MKKSCCDFDVDELLDVLHYRFKREWCPRYAVPVKVIAYRMDMSVGTVREVIKRARERGDGMGLLIMNNGNDAYYLKERESTHEDNLLP